MWYAQRQGNSGYNTAMGDWQLNVYDRETGRATSRTSRWGSAFRPVVSPDNKWVVYGTRHVDTTRLRVRNLETGDERWLVMNAQRIGVQLIIWNRMVWRSNGSNTGPYTGPNPHTDHIHVEITNVAARKGTPWFASMVRQ